MEEIQLEFMNMPITTVFLILHACNTLPRTLLVRIVNPLISAETAHGLLQKLEMMDSMAAELLPTSKNIMSVLTTT